MPRAVAWTGAAAVAAALLLRWTLRDAVWPLSAVFYATPCWVLLIVAVAAFLFARRSGDRPLTHGLAIACVLVSCWCVGKDVRPLAVAAGGPVDFRLTHWNPAGGRRGAEWMARVLRSTDADVICLVEGGGRGKKRRAFWADAMPEYAVAYCGFGYVVLSRHPVEIVSDPLDKRGDDTAEAVVTIDGRPVRLLLFHPESDPLYDRTGVMRSVAARADAAAGEATILSGDFNLPADSVHLDAVRRRYTLASDAAGPMLRPTWATFFPVLTLDQVWLSGSLAAADCRHVWSFHSDHRPVVVDVRFAD